jgi:antitoxin component YwqK of YwqJK toxin-antitoxin module
MSKMNFSSITHTYDENGHIGYRTSMTDGSVETHWTYDQRGRMVEEVKTILN